MYETFLVVLRALHNVNRWAVLIGLAWVLVVLYRGLFARAAWEERHTRMTKRVAGLLDLQFMLGLALYVFGPFGRLAFGSFGEMMGQAVLRFFALEHPLQMVVAVAIAHTGLVIARRAATDRTRFRRAAIGFTLALALILAGIPWPSLPYGRPLLPSLAGLF